MERKSKLIELPLSVIRRLERLAKKEQRKVKPYMEKVLIDHASGGAKSLKTNEE